MKYAWLTILLIGGIAATARAGSITFQTGDGISPVNEMIATVVDGFEGNAAGSSFGTFFVEKDGNLQTAGQVYSGVLSDFADPGGESGGKPDYLDPMTAYLYHQYRTGHLYDSLGHQYGSGDSAQDALDAYDLQRAIWYIEQEIYDGDAQSLAPKSCYYATGFLADFKPGFNRFTSVAFDAVHGPQASWSGIAGVRVMNLLSPDNYRVKDQLVLIHTPLPSAAVPALLLLAAIGFYRRKARRRAA